MRLTARNPRALFFTLAFPLLLIVLFSALNGNAPIESYGETIRFAQFYTPAIAVMSLVTACYTTIVMGLAYARDDGLLKRVRGTPLPMAIYLGAWVTGAAAVGLGAVVLLFAVAVPAFGVHVYLDTLPAAVVTLVLGAGCLAALGVAVASLVKSAEQAQPVVQLTFLPLSFISGIWFPLDGAPGWLVSVAEVVPALPPRAGVRRRVHARRRLAGRPPRRAGDLDGGRAVRRGASLYLGALKWSDCRVDLAKDPLVEEVRVAMALNGGVSLAIWMGGCAVELDAARRAHATAERPVYTALCRRSRACSSSTS